METLQKIKALEDEIAVIKKTQKIVPCTLDDLFISATKRKPCIGGWIIGKLIINNQVGKFCECGNCCIKVVLHRPCYREDTPFAPAPTSESIDTVWRRDGLYFDVGC